MQLLEPEAYALLPMLGLAAPRHRFVENGEDYVAAASEICRSFSGDRFVLKIVSPRVLHKTDEGGVLVITKDEAAVGNASRELMARFRGRDARGVLISEWVEHDATLGGELLLGIRWTPDLGAVVTLGAGGVLTETLADPKRGFGVAIFAPGLTPRDRIRAVLLESPIVPIATGAARGQKERFPLALLERVVSRALDLAERLVPEPFDEIEINPIVASVGVGVALDALGRLGSRSVVRLPRPIGKIERLLRPRSVAIVGVSRDSNPGRIMLTNALAAGFERERIRIIKPGAEAIDGCRCVNDVSSLEGPVDLLVLALPAEQIPGVVEAAIEARKAESILIVPGGMGEHEGTEDLAARIRSAIDRSRSTAWGGPVVNGGNCLGIESKPGRINTVFLPEYKLSGDRPGRESPLAIVSQSGAFAVAKGTKLDPIVPRYTISIGNQIDLTSADYLEYLEADPSIEVFAFYLEGFLPLDGRRWLEAAGRISESGRAVILYRAGRTTAGVRASASHTAAIAGDAVVLRELARRAGVVVAESLDEFEDLVRLFTLLRGRTARGRGLGAISNAGFEAVAFADAAGPFALPPFSAGTVDAITRVLVETKLERLVTIANPLDVNPMMGDEAFVRVASAVLDDVAIDVAAIGCVPLTPALETLARSSSHPEDVRDSESVASRLAELWRRSTKPWVVVVDAGRLYDPMADVLEQAGVPLFRTADRALNALGRWAEWCSRGETR